MKKLFALLFMIFISMPTLAQSPKEAILEIFSYGSDGLKNYYLKKDCESAIQFLKWYFTAERDEKNPWLGYGISHSFMCGLADENPDCLVSGKIIRAESIHKYNKKFPDEGFEFFNSEMRKALSSEKVNFGVTLEHQVGFLGYYYATGNKNIIELMKVIIERSKQPFCSDMNSRKCPQTSVVYFAAEFLKRYDITWYNQNVKDWIIEKEKYLK